MTTLVTDRLILTPHGPDDFAALTRLWADAAFTGQIGLPVMSPETVWFRLLRDIGHWQVFGYGNWAIRLKGDDAYLGSIGLFHYRRGLEPAVDMPEVGWGLDLAVHGRGFGREAVDAALRHADRALGLDRTFCIIGPANTPSLKLAARAGFAQPRPVGYHGETVTLLERARP